MSDKNSILPLTFYYYLPQTTYNKDIKNTQTYFGNTKIYTNEDDLKSGTNSIGQTILKTNSIKYNNSSSIYSSLNTLHVYDNNKNYGSLYFNVITLTSLSSQGLLTQNNKKKNDTKIILDEAYYNILYATEDYNYLDTDIQIKKKLSFILNKDTNMVVIKLPEEELKINLIKNNKLYNNLKNINLINITSINEPNFELLCYASNFNSTYNNFAISEANKTNNIINTPRKNNYLVYGTVYNDPTFLSSTGEMILFSLNYSLPMVDSKNILTDGMAGYYFFVEESVASKKKGGFIAIELNNKQLLNDRGIEISNNNNRSILKIIFSDGDFANLNNKYIYYDADNEGNKTFYVPSNIVIPRNNILSIYKTLNPIIPIFYFNNPIQTNLENSTQTSITNNIDIKDNSSLQEYSLTFNLYSDKEMSNIIGLYMTKIYYYSFKSNNLLSSINIFSCTGNFYFKENNVFILIHNLSYQTNITNEASLGESTQVLNVTSYKSDTQETYNNLRMIIDITKNVRTGYLVDVDETNQ